MRTPAWRPAWRAVSAARLSVLVLAPLLSSLLACSRDDAHSAADSAAAPRAVIDPPRTPYVEVAALGPVGTIRGRIRLEGAPPEEAVARVSADQRVCGESVVDVSVPSEKGGLGGAVVWLRDARRGKRLPLERRYTLTNERCRLEPRVQAALAGGTLNVRSQDPIEHRTRLARFATGETIALVREYDEGQVVPEERVLDSPSLIRATCDLHPWTKGWIAVFDHPYFAVTTADGSFVIDSIPPGRYHMAVWQERYGVTEQEVVVDGETAVEVKVGGQRASQ